MDHFDVDRIARSAPALFGAPEEYLRPEADVKRARAARGEAARKSAEAEGASETVAHAERAARAAKLLSEAGAGGRALFESALPALMPDSGGFGTFGGDAA